ncbi:hypothetical protein G6F59_018794 [Rhizopus arrhizus]|nr:hypothetical protein G6F59_018794 [Rhizopus arrhizus]
MRGLEHGDAAAGREQRPCAVPGDQVETARAHGPDDVVAHAAKQGVAAGTHRNGVQATRRQRASVPGAAASMKSPRLRR